ncbi:hypothetical protein QR680_000480 [Steinernema hermaphroditum]|uniref:Uncharacterized protein n=1 Tax=Steinernema hermaphroditum TaxID=289476 RepID=A0AA39GUR7_9BILA|nr:hypothetical protein QR680_000480 [Steinernema hermaphroditum]
MSALYGTIYAARDVQLTDAIQHILQCGRQEAFQALQERNQQRLKDERNYRAALASSNQAPATAGRAVGGPVAKIRYTNQELLVLENLFENTKPESPSEYIDLRAWQASAEVDIAKHSQHRAQMAVAAGFHDHVPQQGYINQNMNGFYGIHDHAMNNFNYMTGFVNQRVNVPNSISILERIRNQRFPIQTAPTGYVNTADYYHKALDNRPAANAKTSKSGRARDGRRHRSKRGKSARKPHNNHGLLLRAPLSSYYREFNPGPRFSTVMIRSKNMADFQPRSEMSRNDKALLNAIEYEQSTVNATNLANRAYKFYILHEQDAFYLGDITAYIAAHSMRFHVEQVSVKRDLHVDFIDRFITSDGVAHWSNM